MEKAKSIDTVVVQLTHEKAMKLLLDLEELQLIRVIKSKVKSKEKLSEKYAGKLPADIAEELQQHISQSRSEWERNI